MLKTMASSICLFPLQPTHWLLFRLPWRCGRVEDLPQNAIDLGHICGTYGIGTAYDRAWYAYIRHIYRNVHFGPIKCGVVISTLIPYLTFYQPKFSSQQIWLWLPPIPGHPEIWAQQQLWPSRGTKNINWDHWPMWFCFQTDLDSDFSWNPVKPKTFTFPSQGLDPHHATWACIEKSLHEACSICTLKNNAGSCHGMFKISISDVI